MVLAPGPRGGSEEEGALWPFCPAPSSTDPQSWPESTRRVYPRVGAQDKRADPGLLDLQVPGTKPKPRCSSSPPDAGMWASDSDPGSESQILASMSHQAPSAESRQPSGDDNHLVLRTGKGRRVSRGRRPGAISRTIAISSFWRPPRHPGLHEACLLPPSLTGLGRAQGLATVQGWSDGRGGHWLPSDSKPCSLSSTHRVSPALRAPHPLHHPATERPSCPTRETIMSTSR